MDEQRLVRAFKNRLDIYRTKHGRADALADDSYNRWDATKYVVEALELLAVEAGIAEEVGVDLDPSLNSGLDRDSESQRSPHSG